MKAIYTLAILLTTITIIGCGGSEKKKEVSNTQTPITVKVHKTSLNNQKTFVTASGKVEAKNSANLSTRMMGFVKAVNVKVGQRVAVGQLLVSINNSDLQAKKAQVEAMIIKAKAGFKNAKKDYNRFKNLFGQKSVSQKEMDDMTAHYEMAKAGLEAAKQMKNEVMAQFNYVNIKAPFSGVITNTFVKKGDMANPGMPLVSIEGKGKLQVMAMVSESDIAKIKKGMTVKVVVKSINTQVSGKVVEVSLSAKNTGGQYLVKINLDKTDNTILSGMFANVQFPVKNQENNDTNNTITVPVKALVKQGQLTGIYTIDSDNTAILRWLRLGKTFGDNVTVLSGLTTGETYIVSADEKLFNGAKVSVQ